MILTWVKYCIETPSAHRTNSKWPTWLLTLTIDLHRDSFDDNFTFSRYLFLFSPSVWIWYKVVFNVGTRAGGYTRAKNKFAQTPRLCPQIEAYESHSTRRQRRNREMISPTRYVIFNSKKQVDKRSFIKIPETNALWNPMRCSVHWRLQQQ